MAKASSRERLAKHSKGGKDLECQSWQNRFHFRNGQRLLRLLREKPARFGCRPPTSATVSCESSLRVRCSALLCLTLLAEQTTHCAKRRRPSASRRRPGRRAASAVSRVPGLSSLAAGVAHRVQQVCPATLACGALPAGALGMDIRRPTTHCLRSVTSWRCTWASAVSFGTTTEQASRSGSAGIGHATSPRASRRTIRRGAAALQSDRDTGNQPPVTDGNAPEGQSRGGTRT